MELKGVRRLIHWLCYQAMLDEGRWVPDRYCPPMRVDTDPKADHKILGTRDRARGIVLKLMPIVIYLAKKRKHKDAWTSQESLGEECIRTLAHEWRHSQQDLLWETDIPQVAVMELLDGSADYWQDPGEADAREFSEAVVSRATAKEKIMIGRIFRHIIFTKIREARAEGGVRENA